VPVDLTAEQQHDIIATFPTWDDVQVNLSNIKLLHLIHRHGVFIMVAKCLLSAGEEPTLYISRHS